MLLGGNFSNSAERLFSGLISNIPQHQLKLMMSCGPVPSPVANNQIAEESKASTILEVTFNVPLLYSWVVLRSRIAAWIWTVHNLFTSSMSRGLLHGGSRFRSLSSKDKVWVFRAEVPCVGAFWVFTSVEFKSSPYSVEAYRFFANAIRAFDATVVPGRAFALSLLILFLPLGAFCPLPRRARDYLNHNKTNSFLNFSKLFIPAQWRPALGSALTTSPPGATKGSMRIVEGRSISIPIL